MGISPGPATDLALPYPHARDDCGLCGELDADFEIAEEALGPSDWNGRSPRRFCQDCIGRWMATMAFARAGDTPHGTGVPSISRSRSYQVGTARASHSATTGSTGPRSLSCRLYCD